MLYTISVIVSFVLLSVVLFNSDFAHKKWTKYSWSAFIVVFSFGTIICFIPFLNGLIIVYFVYDFIKCKYENGKFYNRLREK